MSNDLAICAYRIHGLEAVVLFGHFFSRANQNALLESVDALSECAQRIDRSLLFLSNGGQSKNRKQNCDQKSLHGFLLFDWYARVAENSKRRANRWEGVGQYRLTPIGGSTENQASHSRFQSKFL